MGVIYSDVRRLMSQYKYVCGWLFSKNTVSDLQNSVCHTNFVPTHLLTWPLLNMVSICKLKGKQGVLYVSVTIVSMDGF